jgi:hypothetical protein
MRIYPYIHNAEELGIAVLGNRFSETALRKFSIDRAEYGRRLARLEGGFFTSKGYIAPDNKADTTMSETSNGIN